MVRACPYWLGQNDISIWGDGELLFKIIPTVCRNKHKNNAKILNIMIYFIINLYNI